MREVEARILVGQGERNYQGKREITFLGIKERVPVDDDQQNAGRYRDVILHHTFFNIFEDNEDYPAVKALLERCKQNSNYAKIILRLTVNQDNVVVTVNRAFLNQAKAKVAQGFQTSSDSITDSAPTVEELYGSDLDNYPG
ncbi:hypothetical protein [uncultured Limosilactobacillus sp.]|uniref:hypothetical protein n=1 Tax=uncultured Limosilactobacillus sp. TaxID=2837629 RepID=UPI0025DE5EE7|nr:hypothetical protein [uncultured Limosilactobacillus sp.]